MTEYNSDRAHARAVVARAQRELARTSVARARSILGTAAHSVKTGPRATTRDAELDALRARVHALELTFGAIMKSKSLRT